MRIGLNPQKHRTHEDLKFIHQVVIPVYLPNEEGYYKDGFTILKLCLESLFKTCHAGTCFTVVDNGSSKRVADYLDELFYSGKIHEVMHVANVGKVNASFKGVSGHDFQLVTITDADVMFLNGWQEATYEIFENFPKTGFVSQVPIPKLVKYNTFEIVFDYLFSKKLKFTKTPDPEALKNFAKSIENPDFYNDSHFENILTLEKNGVEAAVGTGHFLATFRGRSIREISGGFCDFKMGGKADTNHLDTPIMKRGEWRLSTKKNYANHMGNTFESWMQDTVDKLKQADKNFEPLKLTELKSAGFSYRMKRLFFNKFLGRGPVWRWFLRKKGLSTEEAAKY